MLLMGFHRFAKGRKRHTPGVMNKREQRYELVLRARQQAGEIAWYAFEALKLKLADKTYYTPDFLVMLPDGELQIHEPKGFMEDDARVKIKIAAAMFPFRFLVITDKGVEEISGLATGDAA